MTEKPQSDIVSQCHHMTFDHMNFYPNNGLLHVTFQLIDILTKSILKT